MKLFNTLDYSDYLWRVREIADEQKFWAQGAAISLPVLSKGRTSAFASFLYETTKGSTRDNPEIGLVIGSVSLRPDGGLISWKPLAGGKQPSSGHQRFEGPLSRVSSRDRLTLLWMYHELLIEQRGPLGLPWAQVDIALWADLRQLFGLLAEQPLVDIYRDIAPEFINRITKA